MARPEYQSYYLNKDGSEAAYDVADAFSQIATLLEKIVAPGRELAIAKTKLEEACMWARKGVAVMPEHQHGYVPPDRTPPTDGGLS